jgi:DNA polymerase-3 subunit delta
VSIEDVRAVCSDMAAHRMQDMLDAFFTGRADEGVRLFSALLAEGTPGAAMLQAAANHVARLKGLRAAMAGGLDAKEALARARPPIFFRRRPVMERQLRTWTAAALARADESIWQAMRQTRRFPELEAAIAERALLTLALKSAGGRRAA